MRALLLFVLAALVWFGKLVLERDYADWSRRLAGRLVRLAVRLLAPSATVRYEREWTAELAAGGSLAWAIYLPFAAIKITVQVAVVRLGAVDPLWVFRTVQIASSISMFGLVVLGPRGGGGGAWLLAMALIPALAVMRLVLTEIVSLPVVPGVAVSTGVAALLANRGSGAAVAFALLAAGCAFVTIRVSQEVQRRAGPAAEAIAFLAGGWISCFGIALELSPIGRAVIMAGLLGAYVISLVVCADVAARLQHLGLPAAAARMTAAILIVVVAALESTYFGADSGPGGFYNVIVSAGIAAYLARLAGVTTPRTRPNTSSAPIFFLIVSTEPWRRKPPRS